MTISTAVQEARKKMQLARLEQKGKKTYTTFYASQPLQLVRAKQNADWRISKQTLRDAAEALAVAEITGEGLVAAQEAHAIATLVVERSKPGRPGSVASLSGA